jgi:2-oxoglutarate ferredoxin oxidoreductase subunit alpha
VTRDGHAARSGRVDLMVAMNAETYARDAQEVSAGGYLLYDSTWPRSTLLQRDDITLLGIPLARMCNDHFTGVRARILLKNIMYAGALAALLGIDLKVMRQLLEESYGKKPALLQSNVNALELGYDYAHQYLPDAVNLAVERMDATAGHVLIDGNTAAALGCLYAGATVGAWYPITPSTSLMDAFRSFCERWRVEENGEKNFVIVQCEDELSAVGAVLGACWNGARAFTPTSGPGISLMNEFIGLAYYAEVPAVIFDIQRVGPSTGMPTRTQQCDLLLAAYASHGDTRHVLLFPRDPEECFYLSVTAFDLAERLQTPVFVMSDLDIGMNDWMCPMLQWDEHYRPDRGKMLSAEQVEQLPKFHRYLDTDGDGIPYRTLPGTHAKGAYFTRGSGHTQYGTYTEDSQEYQIVLDRLKRKFDTARGLVPAAVFDGRDSSAVGIVSLGSCDGAVKEALAALRATGIDLDYMRVRAFPFGDEVEDFLARHDQLFVVEQNRDAQLRSLLVLETRVEKSRLHSILHYSGLPMSASVVINALQTALAPPHAATPSISREASA